MVGALNEGVEPESWTCLVVNSGALNTCIGDSGGGVFLQEPGGDSRLWAITLGGGGCEARDPGVYADSDAIVALLNQAQVDAQ